MWEGEGGRAAGGSRVARWAGAAGRAGTAGRAGVAGRVGAAGRVETSWVAEVAGRLGLKKVVMSARCLLAGFPGVLACRLRDDIATRQVVVRVRS